MLLFCETKWIMIYLHNYPADILHSSEWNTQLQFLQIETMSFLLCPKSQVRCLENLSILYRFLNYKPVGMSFHLVYKRK